MHHDIYRSLVSGSSRQHHFRSVHSVNDNSKSQAHRIKLQAQEGSDHYSCFRYACFHQRHSKCKVFMQQCELGTSEILWIVFLLAFIHFLDYHQPAIHIYKKKCSFLISIILNISLSPKISDIPLLYVCDEIKSHFDSYHYRVQFLFLQRERDRQRQRRRETESQREEEYSEDRQIVK